MPGSFLHLELDTSGITALIVDCRNRPAGVMEDCRVLYEDLPDSSESQDPFDAGMDRVAQQMDLGMCSAAVIFAPPFSVSFRNVDLPFRSQKKIEQILPFELETLLPGNRQPYVSDFLRLDLENNASLILTASVPESHVETYFSTLGRYGIKPVIITHKGLAAAANFLGDRGGTPPLCIFLHITGDVHTLVLIQDSKPCLARVFNSKHHSPEALAHSINQTIIGFKQRTGLDAVFDIFIDYETEDAEPHDFRKALEKSLKSLSGLRTDEPDDRKPITLEKTDPSFLAAKIVPDKRIHCLFNFCKGKFGSSSFIDTYMLQISIVFILAFLSFAVSIASIHMDISRLETRIAEIDARAVVIFNTSFPATKKIQDPFLQMKANVQAAMKKSAPAGGSSQSVKTITMVDIMGELSKKIDPSTDMEISSFFFNEGRLVLSGSTNNFNTVDNIKSSIESSDWFKRVSISSAAADKQGDRVNFKFIMEM